MRSLSRRRFIGWLSGVLGLAGVRPAGAASAPPTFTNAGKGVTFTLPVPEGGTAFSLIRDMEVRAARNVREEIMRLRRGGVIILPSVHDHPWTYEHIGG